MITRSAQPRTVLALVLALGWGWGCSGERGGPDAAVRADSSGVEIVTSSADDVPLEWTLEPVLRLGGADDGPESFSSVDISRFGSDRDGRLYILDPQAFRVVVFGPGGDTVRTLGREGEGPGELSFPIGMAVAPTGVVRVFDVGRRGLVSYDPSGEPLDPIPFPHVTEPGILRQFALSDSLVLVVKSYRDADLRLSLRSWPVDATNPDSTVYLRVPLEEPRTADFGCMAFRIPEFFAPGIQWDVEGDRVAFTRMDEYRIDLTDLEGRPIRSVRRALSPRAASRADAIAEAGPGLRMRGDVECEAPPEEVVEKRGYSDRLPLIGNLLLSPSGELWVERFVPGARPARESGPIDVFDDTGAYVGTLPRGTPFPIALLADDRVALAERDALDIVRLVIARVERATGGSGSGP